jgi:hypothetical protein
VPASELDLPSRDIMDRCGFVPHEVADWVEEQLAP